MAKTFIRYHKINGTEYASLCTPSRINGKKKNNETHLGKVIDKGNGIYKNHAKGIFKYSIETGFSSIEDINNANMEEKYILDFGNVFILHEFLKKIGLLEIIVESLPNRKDTLLSMVYFRILEPYANNYALNWWEGSYAKLLFPDANLASQRLSEFLKELGDEENQRRFFHKYLQYRCKNNKHKAVIVDSTGLPNNIHFPLTAVNTHGGETNSESRLILVVDRSDKMPLFFRYAAGNIVDVTTLRKTIAELSQYGVETKMAIVDAGYYCDSNVKDLYANSIAFLTRLTPNRKLYKELMSAHIDSLQKSEYVLKYQQRLVYIKRVPVKLFEQYDAYAYVAIDMSRRFDEMSKYLKDAIEDKLPPEVMDEELKKKGVFMLLSSECVDTQDILPMYYTRQVIEQIFDVDKNNVELLPLRIHSEQTFRGHLMLTFLASIAYLSFSYFVQDHNKKISANAIGVFTAARNLKCKVYNNCVLVKEPNKIVSQTAKALGISIPEQLFVV